MRRLQQQHPAPQTWQSSSRSAWEPWHTSREQPAGEAPSAQQHSTKTHPLQHFAADFEVCQVPEGSRPWCPRCMLHSPNEAGSSAAAQHGSLFAW